MAQAALLSDNDVGFEAPTPPPVPTEGLLQDEHVGFAPQKATNDNALLSDSNVGFPAPAPSMGERVENALGGPRIAAAKGFGEGFQREEPLENLPDSAEKALGAIGLAPSKNNVNLFNQTADQLANLGYRGFELAGRVFEGVIHGLGRGGQQALIEAGVEPQAAADIARDVAGGAEIELSRGGEIPMHEAAATAREFAPENVLRQPKIIPPEQAAASSPVMQAGNLDDAIKAADTQSQAAEPYDIEAEAAKADMLAKAGEQQAIIPPHDTLADIMGEEPEAAPAATVPREPQRPTLDDLARKVTAATPPTVAPTQALADEFGVNRNLTSNAAAPTEPIPAAHIKTDTATTAAGTEIPVDYAIVSADDLTASQLDDMRPNPAYPAEVQPRDRARVASEAQIADIANNLRPRELGESPMAANGAPIIDTAGVVESGNARTLAIKRAYDNNLPAAQEYRTYLEQQGYPVENIAKPVLVRIRTNELNPEQRAQFVREANDSGVLGMGAGERAMADASALPDSALDLYRGGDVTAAQNRPFVRAFMDHAVGKADSAGMIGADGSLSTDAARQGWTPRSEITPEGTRLVYRPEFEARSVDLANSLQTELGKMGLGKIAVRVADEIRRPGGEVRANAYYWQRMITMALDTKNPLGILNHEVVHALKDMGLFTPGEWRILEAEARRKWMNDPEIAERLKLYPDVTPENRLEEAVAMAAERGPQAQPSPFAARIFSRVRDFFRALGNALRGNGFATPESIFRDIREGRFGERLNAREGATEPKFARTKRLSESEADAEENDLFSHAAKLEAENGPPKAEVGTQPRTARPDRGADTQTGEHGTSATAAPDVSPPARGGQQPVAQYAPRIARIGGVELEYPDEAHERLAQLGYELEENGGRQTAAMKAEASELWKHFRGFLEDDWRAGYPFNRPSHVLLAARDYWNMESENTRAPGDEIGRADHLVHPDLMHDYTYRSLTGRDLRAGPPAAPIAPREAPVMAEAHASMQGAPKPEPQWSDLSFAARRRAQKFMEESEKYKAEPGAVDAKGKPLPQLVIPGAERSAKQAAASRETGTGRIAPKAPQKEAGALFAQPVPTQADLFGTKPRFALRDEDEQIHDQVSGLVAAATGGDGRGPSVTERDLPRLAQSGIRQLKNLSGVTLEAETIFPRTLAKLDDMSARLWNAWTKKTEKGNANLDSLRRIISDSLAQLPAESRDRVYGALELARKFNWRPADDGRAIRVRNTSYWQAQKSKVGDNYVLSPAETKAFHDTLKLGDEGWRMFMTAMARREGWKGDPDPTAIRASVSGQEGLPEGKRLLRLADALDHAKLAMNRPYFPASRFGDYFIAVRPKLTTDEESLGGFPEVQWFETVEKPMGDDLLGRPRKAANSLPAVKDAIARLRSMTKPDGSLAFPEETHSIETGDLRARPDILRKLNIPAVEKLFSLMERGVTQELTDRIMNEGAEKSEAVAGAKETYSRLAGEAKDTLLDAIYHDLLAGFKKQANLVPGYSADFDKAISSHSGHLARNASEMEHRNDIEAAYQNIQDNHPHQSVKDYWRHWRDYQDSPRASLMGPVGSLSRIGATYVMGLNPSTTIMISAHTPMMAVPVLSAGGSVGRTSLEMTRALKEAYGAIQFDASKGASIDITKLGRTDRERALIADAGKSGLLHAMGADDVRAINDRQAGLWGKMAPTMRKALDISMSNISVVDQANRSAIALVAHRMASDPATLQRLAAPWIEHNSVFRDMVQREGLSPESFAKFMLSEAGGAWGRMNQSAVMRGPEGSLVFALHGFQTRYLSTMFNLVKNMGPEGRVAVGWMAAALWFAAGAYGLPFTQDMENAGDLLWKKITGEDPMIDAHVRQFLSDHGFGKIGTEVMLRGPLSVLLGTDLSSRIGFGDIVTRVVGLGDFMGTIPTIMLGRLTNAYERERSGQGLGSAAAELLPSALRNPARAAIESGQGAESAKGRMEVPAANLSQGDVARQSLGLPPLTVEQAFARNEDLSRLSQRDQELHEQTVASAANLILQSEQAAKAGDAETAKSLSGKLSAMLGEYNRAHWQMPVTGQELSNAILQLTNPDLYRRIRLPHAVQGEAQNRPYP